MATVAKSLAAFCIVTLPAPAFRVSALPLAATLPFAVMLPLAVVASVVGAPSETVSL